MHKNFINQNENNEFIKFRGLDLQELLVEVENYYLEYRNSLGLPNNLTFGIEIEYEGLAKILVSKFIEKNFSNWNSKGDGSLRTGGEITSPIMSDKTEYWDQLKQICQYLTKKNADTEHNAGGHIHIGTPVLGEDVESWKIFLKLYTLYENVLFRFVYGDKINARKKMNKYAPPIADKLYQLLEDIDDTSDVEDLESILPDQKYAALNFHNVSFYHPEMNWEKNTLEFRSPNATTNAIIWQNNINALTKMLLASKNKVINEDFLNYKLKNEYMYYYKNKCIYNCINLKDVLEFVDLIFDNNLDKIYFLRQYLKDKNITDSKVLVLSKKFTETPYNDNDVV